MCQGLVQELGIERQAWPACFAGISDDELIKGTTCGDKGYAENEARQREMDNGEG